MLILNTTLILLVITVQLMQVNNLQVKLKKTEKNIAEIINNELKVDRKKRKGIELKNIDLSEVSIEEQTAKVIEEDIEFLKALNNNNHSEIIEELLDTFQARIGLAYLKCGITAKDIMEGYPMHLEKLKNRPRD